MSLPELAEAYNNLGCCLQRRGSHRKALDYHEIAMDGLLEFFDKQEDNRHVTLTHYNLGLCKHKLGMANFAENLQRAHDLANVCFGVNDPAREGIRRTYIDLCNQRAISDKELRERNLEIVDGVIVPKGGYDFFLLLFNLLLTTGV